jgi:hypothetical protein
MEPGVAFFAADGPTDPLADDADADPVDEDGEETFKTAAYFAELMVHRRLETKWIETGLRDWKTRTRAHAGKRYAMRIYRNYLDPRFCPVTWLLIALHYSGITSGPLFQTTDSEGKPSGTAHSEGHWENTTKRLFTAAGLYTAGHKGADGSYIKPVGVTNSGIRRSAAQWAGRCAGREIDCANNGRWKTYTEMARYMGQGAKRRQGHENDGGQDPIFSMWVWKPVAVGSESTRNEL